MVNILECSSRGDKRFSAFYAKVDILGYTDTIENLYQLVKRNANGERCHKGEKVAYCEMFGERMPASVLTPWYRYLWYLYLKRNPELVAYASQFDDFNDMFKGHSINCQADCIKAFVHKDESFYKCVLDFVNKYQLPTK